MAAPYLTFVLRKCNISSKISSYFAINKRHASLAPHIGKKNARKQQKYMRKVAESVSETKKRKKWYTNNPAPIVQSNRGGKQSVSQGMMRRAKQLNVVFHESIYCSFYYEDVCPQLMQQGLDISKVVISPDFNNLTVYWTASGDTTLDNDIATLLDSCKGKLRSSLMAKRVIGKVPPIQFVKDVKSSQCLIVEKLLDQADMGDDFVPRDLGYQFKSPPRTPFYAKGSESESVDGDSVENPNTSYSYVDGPGAKLIVWKNADFGASSSNFIEHGTQPETNTATDKPDILKSILENQNATSAESEPISCEEAGIMLRNDLYDLDHTKLLRQVMQVKNRFKDRNYELEPDTSRKKELSRLKSKELNSSGLDSAKIHKLLKDSTKTRMSRPGSQTIAAAVLWEDWQSERTKAAAGAQSYEYYDPYLEDDLLPDEITGDVDDYYSDDADED